MRIMSASSMVCAASSEAPWSPFLCLHFKGLLSALLQIS
jgi:hypothetical protein